VKFAKALDFFTLVAYNKDVGWGKSLRAPIPLGHSKIERAYWYRVGVLFFYVLYTIGQRYQNQQR